MFSRCFQQRPTAKPAQVRREKGRLIFLSPQARILELREQIALPAHMRKQFGITPGSVVIIESRNGELALKPAAVSEIERHTDEQIAQWDTEDKLTTASRKRILARLQKA